MNREIKFRGLRTDGKGWVYGYLVITPEGEHRIYWRPFAESRSNTWHTVTPESVGQYTGLKDKNDVEIYEGDKFKSYTDEEVMLVVSWDIKNAKFVIDSYGYAIHTGEGSQEVEDNDLSVLDSHDLYDFAEDEVIGNIHQESEVNNA